MLCTVIFGCFVMSKLVSAVNKNKLHLHVFNQTQIQSSVERHIMLANYKVRGSILSETVLGFC